MPQATHIVPRTLGKAVSACQPTPKTDVCFLHLLPCNSLQVVAQLWVAVIGALLLFVATSWLYGYLSAQEAHAARDLQEVMKTPQGQHSQLPGGV